MPRPVRRSLTSADLTEVSARLRAEWRDEEEEWTRAAVQQWSHARRMSDLVRELAARGDHVTVETAGRRFDGAIVAVGDDRLDVHTAAGVVHLRLALGDGVSAVLAPLVVWRSSPARSGGVRPPSALVTFRARLLELEAAGRPVHVGAAFGGELTGRITVGRDHVVVHAGPDVVLPACWVGYVVPADDADGAA